MSRASIPHHFLAVNAVRRYRYLIASSVLVLSACSGQTTSPTPALLPTRTPATSRPTTPTPSPTIRPEATPATVQAPTVASRYPSCSEGAPWRTAQRPNLPKIPGRIVYLTREGNIALTDPEGRNRETITSDGYISQETSTARVYLFPSFSADGKWLAFVGNEIDGTRNAIVQTVYAARAQADPELVALYRSDEFNIPYLDWSPDNQTVAFLTINAARGAIRLVERDGTNLRVVQEGVPTYWHWRSDSRAMLTHIGGRRDANPAAVIAITPTHSSTSFRVLAEAPGGFQSPQFAPDSRHMLYVGSAESGPDELVLADSTGKPLCTIARLAKGAFFAWSPDGAQVAFMDTQMAVNEPAPLTIFNLETGQSRQIHPSATMFFWSPDGERIAVYSIELEGIPTRITSENGSPRLAAPAQQTRTPVLRIEVVVAKDGKTYRIADTVPSRQFAQYFQFFDQYSRAVTPWSPDGSQLVFATLQLDSNTADIVTASFNAAADRYDNRRIASGILAFWSPR